MNYIKNINTEIKKINKHKDAKILVISGKKSFFKSGANKILKKALEYKQVKFYFKKYKEPNILELKKIINFRDKFKPEIIIAVGGGSVLDAPSTTSQITYSIQARQHYSTGSGSLCINRPATTDNAYSYTMYTTSNFIAMEIAQ